MSDYIRKSEVMIMLTQVDLRYGTITDAKANLSKMPTIDEKEIIRKPMERIVEKLTEKMEQHYKLSLDKQLERSERIIQRRQSYCFFNARNIVKEEGWLHEED